MWCSKRSVSASVFINEFLKDDGPSVNMHSIIPYLEHQSSMVLTVVTTSTDRVARSSHMCEKPHFRTSKYMSLDSLSRCIYKWSMCTTWPGRSATFCCPKTKWGTCRLLSSGTGGNAKRKPLPSRAGPSNGNALLLRRMLPSGRDVLPSLHGRLRKFGFVITYRFPV